MTPEERRRTDVAALERWQALGNEGQAEIRARVEALLAELPDVDPDSPDLSDLREWCLAVKRLGNVTDEESERLLQLAKRVATLSEGELTEEELAMKRRVDALLEAVERWRQGPEEAV